MKALQQAVFNFIDQYVDSASPLILGYSGGEDSSVLFHLLRLYHAQKPLQLHIAHVDHGWRDESRQEAELLAQEVKRHGFSFHSVRFDPTKYHGNLENESRKERLNYFSTLAFDLNAQGILLAHHALDLQETVLKRILDGASVRNLIGMKEISKIDRLVLIRPLLYRSKEEIQTWCQEHKIWHLDDPSNRDTRFLRARMRHTIFPYLKEQFGKEFQDNLSLLSLEAGRIYQYFEDKICNLRKKAIISSFGTLYDLENEQLDPLELEFFIKEVSKELDFLLSREQVKNICQVTLEKRANIEFISGSKKLFVDRGRLFFFQASFQEKVASQKIVEGNFEHGMWEVEVTKTEQIQAPRNLWKDVWRGDLCTFLPIDDYDIGHVDVQMRKLLNEQGRSKSYNRLLTEKRVPRFLQTFVPAIFKKEMIYEDFLTGARSLKEGNARGYYKIIMRLKEPSDMFQEAKCEKRCKEVAS